MPRKIICALTYKPKINGVIAGTITQTIRPLDPLKSAKYKVGDYIAFHGWEGRPYHSKWSFRTPYFEITDIGEMHILDGGLAIYVKLPKPDEFERNLKLIWAGKWEDANKLAADDGIDPPTGIALRDTLESINGGSITGMIFQIIIWDYNKRLS